MVIVENTFLYVSIFVIFTTRIQEMLERFFKFE